MPQRKEAAKEPETIKLQILRDGVFVAEDVRKDRGEEGHADPMIAKLLIERGHAKPI